MPTEIKVGVGMEPITTAIISALSTGAALVGKEIATQAVKDVRRSERLDQEPLSGRKCRAIRETTDIQSAAGGRRRPRARGCPRKYRTCKARTKHGGSTSKGAGSRGCAFDRGRSGRARSGERDIRECACHQRRDGHDRQGERWHAVLSRCDCGTETDPSKKA